MKSGDLQCAETILLTQAYTLNELFHHLARRAHRNMDGNINTAETYLRLALRAQSQCRTTAETLAQIKNPSAIAFFRQANTAAESQQVNNACLPMDELSRAREIENQQSKLLEAQHERLDTRATSKAISADPKLATLGAVNRPKDSNR